jgi:hypothetical protein
LCRRKPICWKPTRKLCTLKVVRRSEAMEKLSRHWPIIETEEKEPAIVLGILFDTIQALRDETAEYAKLKRQLSELRTELSEASKAAAEIGERILNLIPDKVLEAKREMREAVRLELGLEGEQLDKLMAIPLGTPTLGNSGSAGQEEAQKEGECSGTRVRPTSGLSG